MDKKNRPAWAETLAFIYLGLPVFIFFATFMRAYFAVPACVVLAYAAFTLVRRTEWNFSQDSLKDIVTLAATAAIWLWLSGAGGTFGPTTDWLKHYAIENALVTADHWPPHLNLGGADEGIMRYSMAWYLVPALCEKIVGFPCSNWCLTLWSFAGIFLVFRLLITFHESRIKWLAPVIFILFSGADAIGTLITGFIPNGTPFHFEWWAGWVQYSSNTTALFWAPQHAIPAWLFAAVALRQIKSPSILSSLGVLWCTLILWSPFVAIGCLPLLAVAGFQQIRAALSIQNFAAGLLMAVPLLLYVDSDAGTVPHGLIFSQPDGLFNGAPDFCVSGYALFIALEFLVPALALISIKGEFRLVMVVATTALALIPFYKIGLCNDFPMRASLPLLAVIAMLAPLALRNRARMVFWIMLTSICVGVITPFAEIYRSVTGRNPPIDSRATCQSTGLGNPVIVQQYFAKVPPWLVKP